MFLAANLILDEPVKLHITIKLQIIDNCSNASDLLN